MKKTTLKRLSMLLLVCLAITALLLISRSSAPAVSAAVEPSFVDPTASLSYKFNIRLGQHVYIGPFAVLRTAFSDPTRSITIGNESNVQDNTTIDATLAAVTLGEQVIMAHGSTVSAGSQLTVRFGVAAKKAFSSQVGIKGVCPGGVAKCPSFVSFNAVVEGATIYKDAIVSALARVGPDITIPSGYKVLPGKNVTLQGQVNLSSGKIAPVTDADREFMNAVVEVNLCFASQYAQLASEDPNNVLGINFDPGNCSFNPDRDLPKLGPSGTPTQDPSFPNRIIGDVRLHNTAHELSEVMGGHVSLRADEGEPFEVGDIASIGDGVVFHALEHSHLHLGNGGSYGVRSIVHGGPTDFGDTTITGDNFTLGAQSVFYRSRIGNNSRVGFKSVVQQSDFPSNTIIGDRQIIVGNVLIGTVEW